MGWNCPSCGSELNNVAEQLKELAPVEDDMLGTMDQVFGYYCSGCSDFYDSDSLKKQIMVA